MQGKGGEERRDGTGRRSSKRRAGRQTTRRQGTGRRAGREAMDASQDRQQPLGASCWLGERIYRRIARLHA